MKVDLVSYTGNPLFTLFEAISKCYNYTVDFSADKATELVKKCVESGHTSVLEHVSFTFNVSGISRVCSHQLVRHRIASYTQKSQRYSSSSRDEAITPESISSNKEADTIYQLALDEAYLTYNKLVELGISKEDARFVLPNADGTNITITMNLRAFLNFIQERTCNKAQWEIRALASTMARLVKNNVTLTDSAPVKWSDLGIKFTSKCLYTGVCKEKKSCGLVATQHEVTSC